jgi:curved DNA-binding protein CbpA
MMLKLLLFVPHTKHLLRDTIPISGWEDKEDATRIMAELNHAYPLLSDPSRRRNYDERVKPSVNAEQNPVSSEGAHSNEFNREEKVSGRSLHKGLWYVLADFKRTTQTERDRI